MSARIPGLCGRLAGRAWLFHGETCVPSGARSWVAFSRGLILYIFLKHIYCFVLTGAKLRSDPEIVFASRLVNAGSLQESQ